MPDGCPVCPIINVSPSGTIGHPLAILPKCDALWQQQLKGIKSMKLLKNLKNLLSDLSEYIEFRVSNINLNLFPEYDATNLN